MTDNKYLKQFLNIKKMNKKLKTRKKKTDNESVTIRVSPTLQENIRAYTGIDSLSISIQVMYNKCMQ